VLVHLYEEEGVDGIARLRGMFAYALWDERRRQLLLVRDRFGKKPLYYADLPDGLWFASELKSLRAAGLPLDTDDEALRLYFQLGYIPEPLSVYRQVQKLEPGSWMVYSRDGGARKQKYWRLPVPAEQPQAGMTAEAAAEQIRELFDESVRLRMIADVPLGAFLSGGIDSSSVVASMAMQSDAPVKTFSIGFEEKEFNELPAARLVAEKYGTDHTELVVRPDAVDLVSRLIPFFDEPFGDSSAIPTFLVSQAAREHVKVVLTGDGGDELFGGYDSLSRMDRARRFDRIPRPVRSWIRYAADQLPYSFYGKNYLRMASRSNAVERYFDLNYAPYYMRELLLKPDWNLPADNAYLWQRFAESLGSDNADILTRVTYFEATTQLTGDMLVKVDRMSMANSLEIRCPLLDHKLAELAMKIPHKWKMGAHTGKQILLRAVGNRLPADLLQLPKKGFGVPLAQWFRGPLRACLRDILTSRQFLERDIISESFLRGMLDEHDRGRRNNAHWLWMLLVLELWQRNYDAVPMKVTA
jgi:asparagine synthase (glutamine-hydrolysing)